MSGELSLAALRVSSFQITLPRGRSSGVVARPSAASLTFPGPGYCSGRLEVYLGPAQPRSACRRRPATPSDSLANTSIHDMTRTS